MRVLMLCHEWTPLGGGAGHAMPFLIRKLAQRGHEFDVITARWRETVPDSPAQGVRVYTVEVPRKDIHASYPWGPLVYFGRAWPIARSLVKRRSYDLCHAVFGLPAGVLAWRLARAHGIPYLVSLRGSDVPGYDASWRWVHTLLGCVNTRVWKAAAKIVANSEALRELALGVIPSLPIDVIYNGVDSETFKPMETSRQRRDGRFRLISVGRLVERKGLQHVLAALAQLPDLPVELSVVGSGPYRGKLENLCQTYGLSDRVCFMGHVRNEELPPLYSRHDAFVLTSLTESHAMVLTEAMGCGLPVLGSTAGAIPEVVRDSIDGILVEPGNVRQIKEAVIRLATHDQIRKTMGREAMRRVRKEFSWDRIADEYEELYNKVRVADPR